MKKTSKSSFNITTTRCCLAFVGMGHRDPYVVVFCLPDTSNLPKYKNYSCYPNV